jgi:hypothetical protein
MALAGPAPAGAQGGGIDLSSLRLPEGFLDLTDLAISGPRPGTLVATATTTLMGNVTNALVSSFVPPNGGRRGLVLALKPTDWSLTRTFPALANPVLEQLTFQYVGLVITDQELTLPSAALSGEELDFYREIYQSDDFTLVLKPGVNLIAAIPAEGLPADHPMVAIMDALGIEKGVILIQGTLGNSLTLITNPAAGGLDIIKDLYLRAELPPMRPAGSPAWFRSGQIALELTGLPSVRLVGEIGITIDDALLDFFLAATVARTGASLSGGLRVEGGWQQPFGIEWLVIHELLFKLGITPTGSIEPGFAGRMVIGEKDIDVAVSVAISPAGVPTNFMFAGASEAGFGLSDIVMLQQQMRAARDAAAAATGAPVASTPAIPLDALPNIDFRDVALKYAPKPSPELGVERGMAIKGELWIAPPNGEPMNFAGVDINVGEDGLWARGHLAAFTAGPLVWDDAELDLTVTPDDQHLRLSGQVQLFTARQLVDLELTRQFLRFRTESEIYNLFRVTLNAQAQFNLRNPSFQVDGVAESDFADLVNPIIREAAIRFVDAAQGLTAAADATLTGIDQVLGVAQVTADQLRAALESTRAIAEAAVRSAQDAAAQAASAASAALSQRNAAYGAWRDTPARQVVLKAQRWAAYASWHSTYLTRAAAYTARAGAAQMALRVLAAIPPVDQNVLLMQADAAVRTLRAQLEQAQTNLRTLQDQLARLDQQLREAEMILAIDRAEFHASLEGLLRGEAVRWSMQGTFLDAPFAIEETLDFGNPHAAVAQVFGALLGR